MIVLFAITNLESNVRVGETTEKKLLCGETYREIFRIVWGRREYL